MDADCPWDDILEDGVGLADTRPGKSADVGRDEGSKD